jgi:hypothetical protein
MNPEIEQSINASYPNFEEYVRKIRGYMVCPTLSQIKLWHEYLEFQKPIIEELNAAETTRTNKPTT